MTKLDRLFGAASGAADANADATLEEARRETELFRASCFHATPFLRDALADAWRRCEDPPGRPGSCAAERERAETRVGGFEPVARAEATPRRDAAVDAAMDTAAAIATDAAAATRTDAAP